MRNHIIFQLNEDNTGGDGDLLNDEKIKEILKSILKKFSLLRGKFEERYKNVINEENINDFLTKLTDGSYRSDANNSTISLSNEIKVNFKNLFEKYLLKCYEIQSNSEEQKTPPTDTSDNSPNSPSDENLIKKYGVDNKKNILSENNTALTDDIINKLKTINWREIKDNDESIKTQIDKL